MNEEKFTEYDLLRAAIAAAAILEPSATIPCYVYIEVRELEHTGEVLGSSSCTIASQVWLDERKRNATGV